MDWVGWDGWDGWDGRKSLKALILRAPLCGANKQIVLNQYLSQSGCLPNILICEVALTNILAVKRDTHKICGTTKQYKLQANLGPTMAY